MKCTVFYWIKVFFFLRPDWEVNQTYLMANACYLTPPTHRCAAIQTDTRPDRTSIWQIVSELSIRKSACVHVFVRVHTIEYSLPSSRRCVLTWLFKKTFLSDTKASQDVFAFTLGHHGSGASLHNVESITIICRATIRLLMSGGWLVPTGGAAAGTSCVL